MSCWIHPESEAELEDAALYDLTYAGRSIAEAFLDEFARVCDLLEGNQRSGSPGDYGMRAYYFHRFPYTIIYAENMSLGPQIFAVAHQRREPGYCTGRS